MGVSIQLAHGVQGPRLHTNCLRRARTLGLRTYDVRYVCGRGREFEDMEARSHEFPDMALRTARHVQLHRGRHG